MYIVGGYLGYQWADFHCGFEMTFLCEYKVNDHEAWRKRRQMKTSDEFSNDPFSNSYENYLDNSNSILDTEFILNERINYTLKNWLNSHQHKSNVKESSNQTVSTSREQLNSKFKGENFIIKNNKNINRHIMQTEGSNHKKPVMLTTKRPDKNSVIISTHHSTKRPLTLNGHYSSHKNHNSLFSYNSLLSKGVYDMTNSYNEGSIGAEEELNLEQTSAVTSTTTTPSTTIPVYSLEEPNISNYNIFQFLKNVIKLG